MHVSKNNFKNTYDDCESNVSYRNDTNYIKYSSNDCNDTVNQKVNKITVCNSISACAKSSAKHVCVKKSHNSSCFCKSNYCGECFPKVCFQYN